MLADTGAGVLLVPVAGVAVVGVPVVLAEFEAVAEAVAVAAERADSGAGCAANDWKKEAADTPPALDALMDPRGAGVVTLAAAGVFAAEMMLVLLLAAAANAAVAAEVSVAFALAVATAAGAAAAATDSFDAATAAPPTSGDAA